MLNLLRPCFITMAFGFAAFACTSSVKTTSPAPATIEKLEPFVDPRDGRSYRVVRIGRQIWTAQNAAFPTEPSWCYEDDPADCEVNGRLYPWDKAHEACPGGWHLPRDDEWITMERDLGMAEEELRMERFRGTNQGARLRRDGDTGFEAPTSGYRRPDGSYDRRGQRSAFWLATEADESAAWHRDIRSDDDRIYRSSVPKEYALSVRCVRD
jgi:uncharacterized protein (TIGR02145 family)